MTCTYSHSRTGIVLTGLIVCVGLLCGLCGIRWGLPCKARVELLGDDLQAIRQQMSLELPTQASVVIPEDGQVQFNVGRAYRDCLLRTYHPDESLTLMSLAGMNPSKWNFHPHLFQYGGLYIYPMGVMMFVFGKTGLIHFPFDIPYYLQAPEACGRLYVLGRLVSLVFTIGTAVLIFQFGRRVSDPVSACVCALLFLLCPGTILFSHEMRPQAPATFFVLLMFYGLFLFLHENKPRHFWLATLACGTATAMVFTNEFFLLAVLCCVWFMRGATLSDSLLKTLTCCALVAAVYGVCNPYVLLDFPSFLSEARYLRTSYEPGFRIAGVAAFIQHPLVGLLGLPTILLAIWGFICLLRTHKAWASVVGVIAILYCALLVHQLGRAATSVKVARLVFAVFPLLAVAAASGLGSISHFWFRRGLAVLALVWIGFVSWPYLHAFRLDAAEHNTRMLAGQWINQNITVGSSIYVPHPSGPHNLPPFAFARYTLVTDMTSRPEYAVSVGERLADPAYRVDAELRLMRAETPPSFANLPVFIYRRESK